MPVSGAQTSVGEALAEWMQGWGRALGRHWLAWTNLAWALFVGLPWLAPLFMLAGLAEPARVIYRVYSWLCHQLADRSFFLGGPQAMYSQAALLPALPPGTDLWLRLRQFVGTPDLGYKVAWSDRMVSMYGSVLLGGLVFALAGRRIRLPRWWVPFLLAVPMVIDGATHMVSDMFGLGQGFRYDNAWLNALAGRALPSSFTLGNALGSFNSWMRLGTGLLFGLGVAWLLYPALEAAFAPLRQAAPAQARGPRSDG